MTEEKPEQKPEEATLPPDAEERLEELVNNEAEEQEEDLEAALGLDDIADDSGLDQRIKDGKVTETDMITKARSALYQLIGTEDLGPRDLLAIYVRGLALEEARLKTNLRKKSKDLGAKDLNEKARKAFRGRGGEDE